MNTENIPLQKHNEIVEEVRKEAEASLEHGFEEAYQIVRQAQTELSGERQRVEIYQAIAKLERVSSFDCVRHLETQFRTLIQGLQQCAEQKAVPENKVSMGIGKIGSFSGKRNYPSGQIKHYAEDKMTEASPKTGWVTCAGTMGFTNAKDCDSTEEATPMYTENTVADSF